MLCLALAGTAACATDEMIADDIADEVAGDSSELAIGRSPANLYALQQCGYFYSLAGWAYMGNFVYPHSCMPSSPAGHCLQSISPYVYDQHLVPQYLIDSMHTAYKACEQAKFTGGFGTCPAPMTTSTASKTFWFSGWYDEVNPSTGQRTPVHYGILGRAVNPPYTASYWEAVEAFFADSDTCYRAAGM